MQEPVKFAVIELDMHEVGKQNLWVTIGASVILVGIYAYFFGFTNHFESWRFLVDLLLFAGLYMLLIVLHEICHLIGFILFGRVPLSSLKYGVNLKMGIAYATTTELLPNAVMRKALLLPFWLTGVVPVILGFWLQSQMLVLAGAWLIAGAVGDFAMYAGLLKYPKNCLVKDDEKFPRLHLYTLHPVEKKEDTAS